tara:strand:- start:16023 stop:16154 length:132 start_codon:yes stop_codon:yes gene_type:complete
MFRMSWPVIDRSRQEAMMKRIKDNQKKEAAKKPQQNKEQKNGS